MERLGPQSGGGPLYRQVREQLLREIAQGRYPVTDPLPSEQKLAARFGVAQGTVRRALDELARENLVIRHQGRGTFVHAHGPERDRFHFFHLVAADGERRLPTSRVLSLTRRRGSQADALALNLAPQARVVEIKRVRDLMARRAILETIAVPDALFPDLGNLNKAQVPNTLYELYQDRFGVIVHRAVEKITAETAGPEDVTYLGLDRGAPLLRIERVAQTLDGTPVELRVSRCDTTHLAYFSDLV
ncbi:MAG: GntR family transcriptional regulator [Rhodospirillales bacterium CG15_BIG_FIL_POST_REV_8_21_14_020_66_15]|nr:MAG: GntR family transcriptional regulator [Rhodospirillales bacterium CG15_BIG_FIL_POST_REV_8_21_14_020_66_15]